MGQQAEWSDEAWNVLNQITAPLDPCDPYTSMLSQVRHEFLRDESWELIWDDLDSILNLAADQTAKRFEPDRGRPDLPRKQQVYNLFRTIASCRATDALRKVSIACPGCRGATAAPQDDDRDRCWRCGGSGRVPQAKFSEKDPDEQSAPTQEPCPSCEGAGEILGSDCPNCSGTGVQIPNGDDETTTPATVTPDDWVENLVKRLADAMSRRLQPPPDPAFVREFFAGVRRFSKIILLDPQLFSTDGSRTASSDLDDLCRELDTTRDAVRKQRSRFWAWLSGLLIKYGLDPPGFVP